MKNSIIVAIDENDVTKFTEIINQLDSRKCMVKIGSVSFNALGKDSILMAADLGFDIFLDLKLHDIPNTVKKTIEGLSNLPISMTTVHTSGGKKMLNEAVAASKDSNIKILGVTALTSLTNDDTDYIYKRTAKDQVLAMIELAKISKLNGIVCSPHELKLVKANSNLITVTPGIRLNESNDDQARAMSPKDAIKNGSNFIVIGRPITASNNISEELSKIYDSIK